MVLLLENEMVQFPHEGSHAHRKRWWKIIEFFWEPDEVACIFWDLQPLRFYAKYKTLYLITDLSL